VGSEEETLVIYYFDGACGPTNPGGVVQYGWHRDVDEDKSGDERGYGVAFSGGPNATNNIAEYTAMASVLIHVLGKATRVPISDRTLIIRGDSQLAINQFNGEWRVRKGSLRPIAAIVYMLRNQLQELGWTVRAEWVHGSKNTLADKLSRRALNETKMDRHPLTERQNKSS
jgi:ribonuclease HI